MKSLHAKLKSIILQSDSKNNSKNWLMTALQANILTKEAAESRKKRGIESGGLKLAIQIKFGDTSCSLTNECFHVCWFEDPSNAGEEISKVRRRNLKSQGTKRIVLENLKMQEMEPIWVTGSRSWNLKSISFRRLNSVVVPTGWEKFGYRIHVDGPNGMEWNRIG